MRKIVFGMLAAGVATTSLAVPASAQRYDPYYGGGGYSRYDRNGDGYVTDREVRRTERQAERQARRYGNYYGNSYGYAPNHGYGYAPSYGGGYSQYGRYYDTRGYYSGPTWRGSGGRYYCYRSDGSTGTIVGAGAGALIGSQIAGRGDGTLGAILGGAVGAIIGRSVDRQVRCN